MTTTATAPAPSASGVYDAFDPNCPTRQLLDELSDKWVCLVLVALAAGPLRHGELRRRIRGVSQKMLTQTLRALERDGIVERTITPSVPVRVDYELTPLGQSLTSVVDAVKVWAEAHMDQVDAAREDYDTRA
ncbi:winged helix-turn-helix transcriptional regulator [Cellulomonas alba]|uniref:Helix-turn-helix domain-containing protein n=1 Tax=Cellulomonas alba TaxID=3053467 RepID=A0ABT7SED1_9CELL|nr:helix-turn-helix domain-containing protein [Cellulomonas alba]MDM7854548.1 helix-turn-helix domain-containing protein [Cellulomonas alba]